jgi:hypothetical protein
VGCSNSAPLYTTDPDVVESTDTQPKNGKQNERKHMNIIRTQAVELAAVFQLFEN